MKKVSIIIGLSILLGVSSGLIFSEEKYYFLTPKQDKKEITKGFFDDVMSEKYNRKNSDDHRDFVSIENEFNLKY